jgi:AraC-like DNA-binding protein
MASAASLLDRSVEHYEQLLDVSTRTLTRAMRSADGRSAKQVIDDRVTLEARRSLVRTEESVSTFGRRLGFSDTSNFAAFVHRCAGASPTALRARSL